MRRRSLIGMIGNLAVSVGLRAGPLAAAPRAALAGRSRVRPTDAGWPSEGHWEQLRRAVGDRLIRLSAPEAKIGGDASISDADAVQRKLRNPYALGDDPALTQSSGWVDAWRSTPSVYAVAAESSADVAAAVSFAREHSLRLVIKGGGHSYQGNSSAPDSLLVWTRRLHQVQLHDAFVPSGCEGLESAQPAVSAGAGCLWIDLYDAVTTRAGRYVQGGGCTTVGVAGLIQSGGFGSFSKGFGLAAAGLLEAEIATADGRIRVVNRRRDPDLFWALKGGGGGSFGVVTRMVLRTHELPATVGAVFGAIKASSDNAFRQLIAKALHFYATDLMNPHWGEQLVFRSDNILRISMLFQGLSNQQATDAFAPLLEWVRQQPELAIAAEIRVVALPARNFWDAEFLQKHAPGFVVPDDRTGAQAHRFAWASNLGEVGQFLHGFHSVWLSASLLAELSRQRLADALFESTRLWEVGLHFNKGLAGAPEEHRAAAADTATNPIVMDAFALAIIAGHGPPAFRGLNPEPDLAAARENAALMRRAFDRIVNLVPGAGSYLSEGDYFDSDWRRRFWGRNARRLDAIKRRYDPEGLFIVHHGIGSDRWSADGFMQL